MKTRILLTFILGTFTVQAQFEIDSFVQHDEYEYPSKFPIVRSLENPNAAKRINSVLHNHALEKVFREDDENRFDVVSPGEDEFQGASEFDFDVMTNNERFLSLAISCIYTGAYSEYSTQYFNFDTKTGQPIRLSDLFGVSAMYDLSEMVTSAIHSEILEFMSTIDTENEEDYGLEQYEMYAECADWYAEPQSLSEEYYFLTDSSITFVKGRCSNHMMAALDDLWEFQEEYSLVELQSKMSSDGIALLSGEQLHYNDITIADGKILEGKIGGKYPITMILNHSYNEHYYGVYWYNKVMQPIEISGKVDDSGFLNLTEKVNEKTTGSFNLQVIQGGTLDGEWKNDDGTKKFNITLSIAD